MKATLKAGFIANVKPMAGGNAIAQMREGDYVFGEYSTTKSDIVGFAHFYRASGFRWELPVPCKVTAQNMTVTNENESDGPTDPPVPPPSDEKIFHVKDGVTRTFRPIPEG